MRRTAPSDPERAPQVADDRELRAALIGAHLTGLLLNHYLLNVHALATADVDVLIEAVAPVIGPGEVAEPPAPFGH